jgi:hypothetical protein
MISGRITSTGKVVAAIRGLVGYYLRLGVLLLSGRLRI